MVNIDTEMRETRRAEKLATDKERKKRIEAIIQNSETQWHGTDSRCQRLSKANIKGMAQERIGYEPQRPREK